MKKFCLVLVASACLPALASGQVVEEIVTRVNNQIITRSEYIRSKDQLRDQVKQEDPNNADKLYADREKDVLRDLIDQALLLDKGKDLSITGDTELIKRLDQMRKDMKLASLEDLEKEATKVETKFRVETPPKLKSENMQLLFTGYEYGIPKLITSENCETPNTAF